ncbi:hypothetical protein ASPFODRAFT_66059 [Aspergillus luchuensis CBS 106.47]|uniref:Uncharacterized protein n=1 Tax=Aspergillus luchuensis (strain CBS 106.47) TaxID=1137211 RepID=A0A1M3SYK7_ASPLC|nr:hypothetical protein ASPFODRAFT_66059 [Aspergillus luchuensis CBS 106.47]
MTSASPTSRFRLTPVGLRVADIGRSVAFYSGRDTTTVVSLGNTGVANPQADLFAREGVLELGIAKPSSCEDIRFVKVAIGVPDMTKAMEYIWIHNVKILKESGVAQGSEVMASFLGCDSPDKGSDKSL